MSGSPPDVTTPSAWFYQRLAENDRLKKEKSPPAPHIVPIATPYVPFMSEEKRSLVKQGKLEEAAKLPNYMLDSECRLYVEVSAPAEGDGK